MPYLRRVAERFGLEVGCGSFDYFICKVPAHRVAEVAAALAEALRQHAPAEVVGAARPGHPIHATAARVSDRY